jgi:hypothetical protein
VPDLFVEDIDATPNKQVLMSISKDIDLYRGICEMIDNSIDNWTTHGKKNHLHISLFIDEGENKIEYEDNSGGIKEDLLSLIIQPGGTERTQEDETIGIFGVGSKRALVTLSRYSETISRYDSLDTFKIIIDDAWLKEESWKVKKFRTDNIDACKTKFILKELKFKVNEDVINSLRSLIAETYYYYIKEQNVKIKVNGTNLSPIIFDKWAFPPGRDPRTYIFDIECDGGEKINLELTVGLMLESSQTGEYGFDVYCNDRMIVQNVNDSRLGFKAGLLGRPHTTVAWFKGIIRLKGKNRFMPWNSSKSNLDPLNPTYDKLLEKILKFAKPYVRLSKSLSSSSEYEIKPFSIGKIVTDDLRHREAIEGDFPQIPPVRESYITKAQRENKKVLSDAPWTRGLLENILAVDTVLNAKLQNKNRFALILLDSCLEIAFKDYAVRVKKIKLEKSHEFREKLHKVIKGQNVIPNEYWKKIEYYYDFRNKLYHEDATSTLTPRDIIEFRTMACDILTKLHGLTFEFSKYAKFLKEMSSEVLEDEDED